MKLILYYISIMWLIISIYSISIGIISLFSIGSIIGGVCALIAVGFMILFYKYIKEVKKWDLYERNVKKI